MFNLSIVRPFFYFLYSLIFVLALIKWQGSSYTFILVSVAITSLLYLALKYRISAGYVFFVLTMWLGFWLKLSIHVIDPSLPWMEPIGLFSFSKNAWDEVALISTMGCLGLLVGGNIPRIWYKKILAKNKQTINFIKQIKIWWLIAFILIVLIVIVNENFHMVQASIPPVPLGWPFHLQGLFGWAITTGAFILLMILFHISTISGHFLKASILFVLLGAIISISIFSRGVLVIQTITLLAALFVYRDFLPKLSKKQLVSFFVIVLVGVTISVIASQTRRELFISATQRSAKPPLSTHSFFLFSKLPIERWIGLEGVMSMSAHPEKNKQILLDAIKEHREIGVLDNYTKNIALSPAKDTKTIVYATPPGMFAFWYYSGSLLIVFLMSAIFTMALVSLESLVFKVSKNPFLSSFMGVGIAFQLIHMGTGGLKIPMLITITTLIISLVSAQLFNLYIKKIN